MLSNSKDHEITEEVVKITMINGNKKVKWKSWFKNKLIIFTYYLKLFFTLSRIIKLF